MQQPPKQQFNLSKGVKLLFSSFMVLIRRLHLIVPVWSLYDVPNKEAVAAAKLVSLVATMANLITFGLLVPLAWTATTNKAVFFIGAVVFIVFLYACSNVFFVLGFTRPQRYLTNVENSTRKELAFTMGKGHWMGIILLFLLTLIATGFNTAGGEFMLNKAFVVQTHAEAVLQPLYEKRHQLEYDKANELLVQAEENRVQCIDVELPTYRAMPKGTPESAQKSVEIYGAVWTSLSTVQPCQHLKQAEFIARRNLTDIEKIKRDDDELLDQIGALEFLKNYYQREYRIEFDESGETVEIANFSDAIGASFRSYFNKSIYDRSVTSVLTFISLILTVIVLIFVWDYPKRDCFVSSRMYETTEKYKENKKRKRRKNNPVIPIR